MSNTSYGFLDNWLVHLKDVYRLHHDELEAIDDDELRCNRFVELNIQEQVNNLSMVSFIQEEWAKGKFPYIHGWVYGLDTGLIKDIGISVNENQHLNGIYRYEKMTKVKV